jgi:hypothetical protein
MHETAIGLEVTSRIFLSEEINSDDANEILIDIENHITNYMKEKYNAVVGGSGKLIYNKGELNER